MKRDYGLFIKDILDSITKIEDFVDDMNFDEFVRDDKTTSAVIRKLEINGMSRKALRRAIPLSPGEKWQG